MPEWPNGIDSKSIVAAMPPRVRIPVSPPHIPLKPAPVAGLSFLVCAGPYFSPYFGACEGSHRVAIREASANVTAFFSFLGLTRLGVLAVVVRSWPSSPVLCVSRLARIAQFCAVRIAHFAQFPNQLNPPQSLVLLGLPANEQPFCAARSWYSFLDELRNLRRMEISKTPTREKGIPWLAFSGSWSGCHQNGDSVTNTVTI